MLNSHRTTNHYRWTGIDTKGNKITGDIDAKNLHDAQSRLLAHNVTLLSLNKKLITPFLLYQKTLPKKALLDFTQQLQLLLQSNISLIDALMLIESTMNHIMMKKIVVDLKENIQRGDTLSVALKKHAAYFDNIYCQLIYAGEQTGQLTATLSQIVAHITAQSTLQNKIKKALFYPLCVLSIAIVIAIGLLIFVIPQFSTIYHTFGAQLPTLTQLLINMSHVVRQHGILFFIMFVMLILGVKLLIAQFSYPKVIAQQCFFKIPLVQSLVLTKQIAQWSQLLSTLLSTHLPLIDALHIANHGIDYPILREQLTLTTHAIIQGQSFYQALDHCRHFPIRAKQLIAIGENADALDIMMSKIAILYQQELQDKLEHLSKLIEPVMMIFVSVLIGSLVIAMYLPIFRMGSVI